MSDMSEYRDMLREVHRESRRRQNAEPDRRPPKRRKRKGRDHTPQASDSSPQTFLPDKPADDALEIYNIQDDDDSNIASLFDVAEVNRPSPETINLISDDDSKTVANSNEANGDDDDGDDDEFGSDEFEEVSFEDADNMDLQLESAKSDQITVSIPKHTETKKKKVKKNVNLINRDEKLFRKSFHMSVILIMACHGLVRNNWISDPSLLSTLNSKTPMKLKASISSCLSVDSDQDLSFIQKQIQSRKLLDCLKQLMSLWNDNFKVNNDVGIYKKLWNELDLEPEIIPRSLNKQRFKTRVIRKRGSRDIAAQGFVALLRSVGLHARLVFSLQPPDFTNNTRAEQEDISSRSVSPSYSSKARPSPVPMKNLKGLAPGEKLLAQLRNKKIANTEDTLGSQSIDKESEFPVFWAEVWDKFSQKWISIDAVCFKFIEVVRVTSKFEPPSTDERNNAYYVLGYDNDGRVRDLTRRYARNYNAKIRKKRITREPKGEVWYAKLLDAICSKKGRFEIQMDKKEQEYFNRKSLQEGMPNSIQDFKGHPIYVLEDQLRSNEILTPKTPCGRTRKKNSKSSETIPVYKRENVHMVRSAKAWYMHGRVLKPGERPMLIRKQTQPENRQRMRFDDDLFDDDGDGNDMDENDDTDKRLYSEAQTELYVPPLCVDGEVPKNAYGNIDLYVDTMLPANACHRESKFAIKAAKSLGIDFAEAVIGFDFSKNRSSTIRTKGVVVAKEYEDAISQAEAYLEQQDAEKQRKRQEAIGLRSWRILLTKLRIKDDLNKKYGDVDNSQIEEAVQAQFIKLEKKLAKAAREEERYYSSDDEVYGKFYDSTPSNESDGTGPVENDGSDDEFQGGGGFLPEPTVRRAPESEVELDHSSEHSASESEAETGGGFYIGDAESPPPFKPRAFREDANETAGAVEGGFVLDINDDYGGLPGSASISENESHHSVILPAQSPRSVESDGHDFEYDPKLQEALLNEMAATKTPSNEDRGREENKAEISSDTGSISSLNSEAEGVEEESLENEVNDNDYYDDNEFEYSDDD